MAIDNLKLIRGLLHFNDDGDFYMLYVLKRKKDQPAGERDNHQSVRTIKSYCIESLEHLEKRWDEIKMLCEVFGARAYIHVQSQNHRGVSLTMMMKLAERIKSGSVNQHGLFDSAVGSIPTREKRWIVDIDSQSEQFDREIQEFVNGLRPLGPKIIANVPTKQGHHLITERFDVQEFKKKYPDVDIQKKNPTLLYLPDSLDN